MIIVSDIATLQAENRQGCYIRTSPWRLLEHNCFQFFTLLSSNNKTIHTMWEENPGGIPLVPPETSAEMPKPPALSYVLADCVNVFQETER